MRLYQHAIDMHGFSVVFEIVVSLKAGGISKVNRILRHSEFDLYFATVLIDLRELTLKSTLEIKASAPLGTRS